jgi:hypothetical protein
MKTALKMALVLGFAGLAAPTFAAAKPGDLYVNADGSCDKGDSKKGYWCVESLRAKPKGTKASAAPAYGKARA